MLYLKHFTWVSFCFVCVCRWLRRLCDFKNIFLHMLQVLLCCVFKWIANLVLKYVIPHKRQEYCPTPLCLLSWYLDCPTSLKDLVHRLQLNNFPLWCFFCACEIRTVKSYILFFSEQPFKLHMRTASSGLWLSMWSSWLSLMSNISSHISHIACSTLIWSLKYFRGCHSFLVFGKLSFSLTLLTKSGLLSVWINGQNLQLKNCSLNLNSDLFSKSNISYGLFPISPSSWIISPSSISSLFFQILDTFQRRLLPNIEKFFNSSAKAL